MGATATPGTFFFICGGITKDCLYQPIKTLSGSERMRVALARIILAEPDALILDEPTNHLDIRSRECLEDALREFKGTVIAVSHDRYFLDKVAGRILEISECKIHSYEGNYTAYKRQVSLAGEQDKGDLDLQKARRGGQEKGVKASGPRRASATRHESEVRESRRQDPDELEAEIIALEEQARSLEELFADPSFYSTPDCYIKIREHEQITDRLSILYDVWDRLEDRD
ncbi:MAG: ABC-F family ATP-binding cassette domain-containing protein [Firmicutes bacterium]|nr:ABC-F family ATP-binding cassette domain-containing protein [Bacillota bacterium]